MNEPDPIYWPFPVLPPEQLTAEHRKELAFFERAFAEGFRPGNFRDSEYRADSPAGRTGWMIYRGHQRKGSPKRWEVWLDEPHFRRAYFWVEGVEDATEAILLWLRGGVAESAVALCEGHILRGPTYPDPSDSLLLIEGEPAGLTPP